MGTNQEFPDATLEGVLKLEDLPIEPVDIPLWKMRFYIRSMTAEEKAELERQFSKKKPSEDPGGFRRAILQSMLVNKDKSKFLRDDESTRQFMTKNSEPVETLFEAGCAKAGFRQKDVEQLEKNSQAPQP